MSYLEGVYNEVSSTSAITPENFGNSTLDFPFSVGRPNVFYPAKSYFRVSAEIFRDSGAGQLNPRIRDGIAYSMNPVANLFSEAYFQMGGNDVSKLNNFHPQASTLKSRILNSQPYLSSLGLIPYMKPDLNERIMDVSYDATTQSGTTYQENDIYPLYLDNHYFTALVGSPSQQVTLTSLGYSAGNQYAYTHATTFLDLTQAGGGALPLGELRVGDIFRIPGGPTLDLTILSVLQNTPAAQTFIVSGGLADIPPTVIGFAHRVREDLIGIQGINTNFLATDVGNQISIDGNLYTIASQASATRITITPPLTLVLGPTTNFYGVKRNIVRSTQGKNSMIFMWQPPLGIFSLEPDKALGNGDYRLRLTPSPNWKNGFVETLKNNAVYGTDFSIKINDIKFYYFSDKSSIPDDSYFLHLNEMMVQSKPYSNSLQFSVPSSTFAISVFLQSADVVSNTKSSPTVFKCAGDEDLYLNSIQLTYGGITKTATSYQSNWSVGTNPAPAVANVDRLQQRYLETYEYLANSGLTTNGCETFENFLKSGMINHFDYSRDSQNRATEVQLQTNYGVGVNPLNCKMFVVAWYRNTISYTTSSGSIVSTQISSV